MNKKNNLDLGQESIEEIQNLFQELLLLDDIDSERKLLEKRGIDVDEKSLEAFHQKKKELFVFVKENKSKLSKLDVNELESVSGGIEWSKVANARTVFHAISKLLVFGLQKYLELSKTPAFVFFSDMGINVLTNVIDQGFKSLKGAIDDSDSSKNK